MPDAKNAKPVDGNNYYEEPTEQNDETTAEDYYEEPVPLASQGYASGHVALDSNLYVVDSQAAGARGTIYATPTPQQGNPNKKKTTARKPREKTTI